MNREKDILTYISHYCTQFMTDKERAASNHYTAHVKLLNYKDRSENALEAYNRLASNDPEVLKLLDRGYTVFLQNYTRRIYEEHFNDLDLNLCPKCKGIARTPEAKQCRYCKHSWRD